MPRTEGTTGRCPENYVLICGAGCPQSTFSTRKIKEWAAHHTTVHSHRWTCNCSKTYDDVWQYRNHVRNLNHFHEGDMMDPPMVGLLPGMAPGKLMARRKTEEERERDKHKVRLSQVIWKENKRVKAEEDQKELERLRTELFAPSPSPKGFVGRVEGVRSPAAATNRAEETAAASGLTAGQSTGKNAFPPEWYRIIEQQATLLQNLVSEDGFGSNVSTGTTISTPVNSTNPAPSPQESLPVSPLPPAAETPSVQAQNDTPITYTAQQTHGEADAILIQAKAVATTSATRHIKPEPTSPSPSSFSSPFPAATSEMQETPDEVQDTQDKSPSSTKRKIGAFEIEDLELQLKRKKLAARKANLAAEEALLEVEETELLLKRRMGEREGGVEV